MEMKVVVQKVETVHDSEGVTMQHVELGVLLSPIEFKSLVAASNNEGSVTLLLKK